jgi:dipeptidyl aminopeptidase/acylaminoacyl peptidase
MPAASDRLTYWLGGPRSAKANAYRDASPATFISADDPPMFFFHGERDELVPIVSPAAMVAMLNARGVKAEIYTVPKSGHFQAAVDRDALKHVLAFADQYLKDEGGAPRPATSGGVRDAVPAASNDASEGGTEHGK